MKKPLGGNMRAVCAAASIVLGLGAGAAFSTAEAQQSLISQAGPQTSEVTISVGKSRLIQLGTNYTDVQIANPAIADIVPVDTHTISLVGKSMGATALTIFGANKVPLLAVNVVVSADLEDLKSRLSQIVPGENNVAVSAANQSIVLSGSVSSPAALQQVLALSETYDPGRIVNLLSVQGTQQVMLSVRFVEMDRMAANNLRLNVSQTPTTGQPQIAVTTGDTLLNSATAALNTFGNASLLFRSGGGDLTFLFDALETKGLAKTLAEPTLVALSGDTASFLAGGEFPIPINAVASTGGAASSVPYITIQFKEFGISLAFTPTILADGLVNMVINPEVSSIDPTTSVNTGLISVPGLKVRRAHTTVELRDGESFTIAGLLEDDYQNNIRQFPFIGDLPILGTLFRSTGYQRNETELVMVVTPHLVTPRRGNIATPADQFVPPSDFELFLLGEQRGGELPAADRALLSVDPTKGGLDGPYGHVLY